METNEKNSSPEVRQRRKSRSELSQSSSENESVTINGKKIKKEKPIGSRSKWSTSNMIQRLIWLLLVPLRALLCFSNITVFFATYFGFILTVVWARKLWFVSTRFFFKNILF